MADQPGAVSVGPRSFLAVFSVAWALVVVWLALSMPPEQRLLSAGPVAVVGAVIGALGYLSMVKRRAVRARQDSIQKMLKLRRQERETKK